MSATNYRLSQSETLALAHGRLADIESLIAEGDTTADWRAERTEQLRLIAQVAA